MDGLDLAMSGGSVTASLIGIWALMKYYILPKIECMEHKITALIKLTRDVAIATGADDNEMVKADLEDINRILDQARIF